MEVRTAARGRELTTERGAASAARKHLAVHLVHTSPEEHMGCGAGSGRESQVELPAWQLRCAPESPATRPLVCAFSGLVGEHTLQEVGVRERQGQWPDL